LENFRVALGRFTLKRAKARAPVAVSPLLADICGIHEFCSPVGAKAIGGLVCAFMAVFLLHA
jgi:hypothetical protein